MSADNFLAVVKEADGKWRGYSCDASGWDEFDGTLEKFVEYSKWLFYDAGIRQDIAQFVADTKEDAHRMAHKHVEEHYYEYGMEFGDTDVAHGPSREAVMAEIHLAYLRHGYQHPDSEKQAANAIMRLLAEKMVAP